MKTLLHKLNWRLIIIHFLAVWFMMVSLRSFAFLYDYQFFLVLVKAKFGSHQHTDDKQLNDVFKAYPHWYARLVKDQMYIEFSTFAGAMIAFFTSLFITIKKHWFWLNSLIAFLILYLLHCLKIVGQSYLPFYLIKAGRNLIWLHILISTVISATALFLLLSRRSKNIIERGVFNPIN